MFFCGGRTIKEKWRKSRSGGEKNLAAVAGHRHQIFPDLAMSIKKWE
jgi:hypothetical protein